MKKLFTRIACLALAATIALASCEGPEGDAGAKGDQGDKGDKGDKGDQGDDYPSAVELKAHSKTEDVLIKKPGFENLEVFNLISSEDLISGFTFGGSADGLGILKLNNGYNLIVNHEDNFSVSRIFLDETFRPVSGEYIMNSMGGQWRLCSATLATPEEHGFGPLYLTCGESGVESRTHALNPFAQASQASQSHTIDAFGRWSAENAVPLPKTAYKDSTVILIGDDDSGPDGGQLAMYFSDKGVGELAGGKVYVLRREDLNTREMDITEDAAPIAVEFVEIPNISTMLGSDINAKSTELKSLAFNRVEDIDYRKDGVGREIYFNATGANGNPDRTKYGRTYRLVLDAEDPLKGTLELILDGDKRDGKAGKYQNPDNIMVTENYVYVQEDPNVYTDETHDAQIYQYTITSKELKPVFELNHYRNDAVLNQKFKSKPDLGSWEYGALTDISDIIGVENTFLLCIQPHSWVQPEFRSPDGGNGRPNEMQGSLIAVIKGLPR